MVLRQPTHAFAASKMLRRPFSETPRQCDKNVLDKLEELTQKVDSVARKVSVLQIDVATIKGNAVAQKQNID